MKRFLIILFAFAVLISILAHSADEPKRKAELDEMLKVFPKYEAWEQWLKDTGELPPDFDALPSIPYLPDLLAMQDGTPVTDAAQWEKRRAELQVLIQHYITGTIPPSPGNVAAASKTERREGDLTIQDVLLQFGPENRASLNVQLIIPDGKGPFPVFITQDNHYRWALIAAARGYLGCVYAGADSRDDTKTFIPVWPEYDWTKLARRAWAAGRCIDYLETQAFADTSNVCLTGHSRNGKLSIIGGCFDPRITAVISSSSGAGGACPARLFAESHFGEGIELLSRAFPDWMHPRLRFFAGRENKLPVDQHSLIACTAPRSFLFSTAYNDDVESVWAIEHAYQEVKKVYRLLGAENRVQLMYRWGTHETQTQDIETYLDWLDGQFQIRPSVFEESKSIYPTYEDWQAISGETIEPDSFPEKSQNGLLLDAKAQKITTPQQWAEKAEEIRQRIQWALGDPPSMGGRSIGDYGSEYDYLAAMFARSGETKGVKKQKFSFGNYIAGDLYYPEGSEKSETKIPAVVWLHSLNNAGGYIPNYRRGPLPHLRLVEAGFAVLTYDQIGNGYRLEEITHFYNRYPQWSLLGKAIADARSILDVLDEAPFIDPNRVFLVGYDMGAKVALHTAALDPRFAGVVSVAGFTPMRLDTAVKGTGGIARWTRWLPLVPKLGAFEGKEKRIPYDYHEVLAAIAPRPVLVVAPTLDLQADIKDITACVTAAKQVYQLLGAASNLQQMDILDYNRYSPELQNQFIPELGKIAGLSEKK